MNDPTSKREVFINALIMTHADGVSDPRERTVLWDYKEKVGITDEEAAAWYAQVRAGDIGVQPLHRTGEALEMIELLAEIAAADGLVTEEERAVIREVAQRCGLSAYSLEEITARVWKVTPI